MSIDGDTVAGKGLGIGGAAVDRLTMSNVEVLIVLAPDPVANRADVLLFAVEISRLEYPFPLFGFLLTEDQGHVQVSSSRLHVETQLMLRQRLRRAEIGKAVCSRISREQTRHVRRLGIDAKQIANGVLVFVACQSAQDWEEDFEEASTAVK